MTDQKVPSKTETIFSPEQLQRFETLMSGFTKQQHIDFKEKWDGLVEEIKNNLHLDPKSDPAKNIAQKWLDFVHTLYGHHYLDLYQTAWQAHKAGKIKIDDIHHLSSDFIAWIESAITSLQITENVHPT